MYKVEDSILGCITNVRHLLPKNLKSIHWADVEPELTLHKSYRYTLTKNTYDVPKQRAVLLYTKRILTLRCPTLYNEYSDSALSYFIQSGF